MVLKRLFGWFFGGWPRDLPRFYPEADELRLAEFMSRADYALARSLDNVYVLPFAGEDDDEEQDAFGFGLSRLMIRNLMLLRDASIHGPEDTPRSASVSAAALAASNRKSCYVSGAANFGESGFSLRFEVRRPGRATTGGAVSHADFAPFVRECAAAIGRGLGSRLETSVPDAWETGQPRDLRSLLRYGLMGVRFDRSETAARARAAREALSDDPNFVLPAWEIDDELPEARPAYLEALRRDPHNAQLCFLTFCSVWLSKGPQPEAVQFCRKAIELACGHGKAHMCAPHAAPPHADMLRHSELGYRLLPGNPFAVNNYVLYLRQIGAPPSELVELAKEGIAVDPCDPGNYDQAISLCCEQEAFREALEIAERLQALFEPEMDERALYCLKQNPERARQLNAGEYDPATENRDRIAQLRELVSQSE